MKKNAKLLSLMLIGLITMTGCNNQNSVDENGRVIYNGGDGMNDNKLTIFRWNFAGINSAKKANTTIYKKLKEVCGMNLQASSASAGDWQTKLNTMFGTQMLPDIFVSMGPERSSLYNSMIDDGVLVCVSDFVSETEYPNIYHQLQKYDFLTKNVSYTKGKHWSIPVSWNLEHTMYIRLDWLNNLNKKEKLTRIIADEQNISESSVSDEMLERYKFTEPKDLLEFYRLCRAFTLYDPDENGKDDTYGYTSAAGEDLFADCWMFIALNGGWNSMIDPDKDGIYEPSWTSEGCKKAIAFLNDLYKSGYVQPNFYENTTDSKQEAFAKGNVGMIEGHAWYNNIVRSFIAANTTSTYAPTIEEASNIIGMFMPPAGPTGVRGISGNPNFWTVTCLNNGMSNAELTAALKLIDYMLSDEGYDLLIYGQEGEHFKYEDGKRVSLMGKAADGFNRTLSEVDACAEIASVTNWSTGYLTPYQTNADKVLTVMEQAKSYLIYPDYPFLQTDSYVKYWDIIRDFAEEQVFKMLCSNSTYAGKQNYKNGFKIPTSYDEVGVYTKAYNDAFTTFVNNYNQQGGSAITKEYNEAIKTAMKA